MLENKTDEVGPGDQQNMQDVGMCDDEERDLCFGFNMAGVNLSFENYEDIFEHALQQLNPKP